MLARPQHWEATRAAEDLSSCPAASRRTAAALGRGERILARLTETRDGYEARIIKRLGASVHRVLGVYHTARASGRIAPIDRKSRYEFIVDDRDRGGAQVERTGAGRAACGPRVRAVRARA